MTRFESLKFSPEKLVEKLCIFLLGLMFVSKISLKYLKVPRSFSYFIFQHGLHPYINFGLNFLIGGIILFYFVRRVREHKFKHQYIFLLIIASFVLLIQTLFQIAYVHPMNSWVMQIGGLVIALALIMIYGVMIPDIFSVEKFVKTIRNISVPLVILSVCLLPLFNVQLFRGGRFIGVFKHIPHMVSASTFAFIFYFPQIFNRKISLIKRYLILFILFIAVFLTATKAAMITVLIVSGIGVLTFGRKDKNTRIFKFIFVFLVSLFIILFGAQLTTFLYEVASGQTGFLMRPAQDGIATRMEEVTRGIQMFMEQPHFGQGILYKFMSTSGINVGGYNSFKDPHNIFVSAGVIGGWPFMAVVTIGFILMIVGSIRGILKGDENTQVVGIFLLSHIPVFVIYHVHLSLGGMGDRMYWLIFGYLAIKLSTGNLKSV
ncbi:O-antigen ligase family protein [Halobacteriovorax sp.]|uniref:O-antigen ligase family protein n=1 Tax=Halobacteriovorax sp. TaxID=2020862 RepID=UPI0035656C23